MNVLAIAVAIGTGLLVFWLLLTAGVRLVERLETGAIGVRPRPRPRIIPADNWTFRRSRREQWKAVLSDDPRDRDQD